MNFTGGEILERELLARAVAGLQYMLNRLSTSLPQLPGLAVDGVFGERTLEAVVRFQRVTGLPVTGVVDRRTWNVIHNRWLEMDRADTELRPARMFPSQDAQVDQGDSREYMILPQAMFQILGRYFAGIGIDQPDGFHGKDSADNVRWLQRAAGLPVTGVMDRAVWDALSRLYEIFVVKEPDNRGQYYGGWG